MDVLKLRGTNDNTHLGKQQEDVMRKQEEDQVKEKSIKDNIQVINDVKEPRRGEEINEKVAAFLHEKDLGGKSLVETLSDTGLTDEYVRLLKTLNLKDDDIDNSQDLRQAKIEVDKSGDPIDSTSDSSLSNYHTLSQLSSNNMYLKEVLSKPLIQALCEIVAKKPTDPVEYLGHWLLHYKICEERAVLKEPKSELLITMEKLKKVKEKEDFFIERKDEEEYGEDRNYIDY